jgi:endonuclease I
VRSIGHNTFLHYVKSWVWEPHDEMKGNVAKVIFYMTVRYEGENGELNIELTDSLLLSSSQLPLHGNARTLYNWHFNDTVSIAERSRNDTIYKYQNNRNPFIDHIECYRISFLFLFNLPTSIMAFQINLLTLPHDCIVWSD